MSRVEAYQVKDYTCHCLSDWLNGFETLRWFYDANGKELKTPMFYDRTIVENDWFVYFPNGYVVAYKDEAFKRNFTLVADNVYETPWLALF